METLQELVSLLKDKQGIAKSWKEGDLLKQESFGDYYHKIDSLSKAFMNLGIGKNSHVAHFADNNPDWIAISLALNNIGAVDVPRGTDASRDELSYILDHSDSDYLLVKDEKTFKKVKDKLPKRIAHVVSLDDSFEIPISELLDAGKNVSFNLPKLDSQDLSGIIYSSGTTGKPKGVMLTHNNFISNFPVLAEVEGMDSDDKWISVLPPWHVFQRAAEYCSLYTGALMHHTEVARIGDALTEIQPTILPTVPRVWESMYAKFMKNLNNEVDKMPSFRKKVLKVLVPQIIPNKYIPKEIKQKLWEKMGGNLRFAVSGGGALPHYLDDFYIRVGIPIIEGYGMSETSPVISARIIGSEKRARHTVGEPMPNIEVKIADPDTNMPVFGYGEVQVSGPIVMLGYYKDKEATDKVIYFENGKRWFKTGDRGRFTRKNYLQLDGRYKETIIGSDGENIDPVSLEDQVNKNPLIDASVVFKDDDSNLLYALTFPNFDNLKSFCTDNNIVYDHDNLNEVLKHPVVQAAYKDAIKQYNKSVKNSHKISDIALMDKALELGTEITNTLKLRRKEILENRKYHINELVNKK
ncbi:MAG: AMP-binding protein [Prolixibacteraceae bacterium]|nr:AMP-binding protein [Prolixibacteraceae bacterium]